MEDNSSNIIKLTRFVHREQSCIGLVFPFNNDLTEEVKKLPGVKWTKTHKCWYIANNRVNLKEIFRTMSSIAHIDKDDFFGTAQQPTPPVTTPKKPIHLDLPPLLKELEEEVSFMEKLMHNKRYSEQTIKNYLGTIKVFLRFTGKPSSEITNNDVHHFNNQYIIKNKLSSSYQNIVLNAIKLFYLKIGNRKIDIENLERPFKEKKLPNVLSKEEMKALLGALSNVKHKAMLSLIYACGLRRSELLNLKIHDIHSGRKLLLIKQSKGRKDRVAPLSEKTIEMLREYYRLHKPREWLFEGQKGGKYSAKSLESFLKQAVNKAGIRKPVTLHWLRHTYATHMLENGTNLRYIQEIMGHASSKTTEIYTHVSSNDIGKIKSPFDEL